MSRMCTWCLTWTAEKKIWYVSSPSHEYKFDDDGYLLKFKSRLVARGDKMPPSDKRTRSDTLAAYVPSIFSPR
jgi:hypothetical protein